MARHQLDFDPGLYWDDETDGVYTADGGFYGYLDENAQFVDVSDGMTEAAAEALYNAGAEAARDLMFEEREERALETGYSTAVAELEDIEAEQAESDGDFDTAMEELAGRLGRPVSETEAARIDALLPDREYTDDDVSTAAVRLGIRPFHSTGDERSQARAAEARSEYLNARAHEMDQDDQDEYTETGGGNWAGVEESGGMFGDLVRNASAEENAHASRLQQATSNDDLNSY